MEGAASEIFVNVYCHDRFYRILELNANHTQTLVFLERTLLLSSEHPTNNAVIAYDFR